MYKFLIIALLFVSVFSWAQDSINTQKIDTLTYQYVDSVSHAFYLTGNWKKLEMTGKQAIDQQIDFKRLRQRMGYAYFAQADYFAAKYQYEKALEFDKSDADTRIYLYYCGLYTGNEAYARYQMSYLSPQTQKLLNMNALKFIDALDFEYNYKINDNSTRSNPSYYKIGISTKLGYRLNLYQAVSYFSQWQTRTIPNDILKITDSSFKNQTEYYGSIAWQATSSLSVSAAYHGFNATVDDTVTIINPKLLPANKNYKVINKKNYLFQGNMIFGKLSLRLNRFDISFSASSLKMDSTSTSQIGIHAGYMIPGQANLYIKSSLIGLIDNNTNRLIFSQNIGLILLKNTRLDGNVTVGNLKNYAEFDGLYVYNSDDETLFKTGFTFYWSATKNITFFSNCSYNYKQISNSTTTYNQQSLSGGIIWKL